MAIAQSDKGGIVEEDIFTLNPLQDNHVFIMLFRQNKKSERRSFRNEVRIS